MSNTDITTLLERWDKDKKKVAELETRIEKYKKLANKLMDKQGQDKLNSDEFTLKRRNQTRSMLTKSDVPADVWDEYSRTVTFQTFYLTRNKN